MTPYSYLITPEGDRYNNAKQIEGKKIIVNTTMDETDYKYTNRIGKVIGVPRREGPLEVGDRVIVHHNTFRQWFNVRGNLKESANHIKGDVFYVGPDQLFAYDRGDGWVCLEDYCFIRPIEEENDGIILSTEGQRIGEVAISNPILEAQGVKVGDKIAFTGNAKYVFEIDGEVLWKMSAKRNVSIVYETGN